MRQYRKGETMAAAKAFFLQFPEATIKEAHRRLVGVSERTIAQARSELATDGLLKPGRNLGRRKPAREPVPVPDSSLIGTAGAVLFGTPPVPTGTPAPRDPDRLLSDEELMRAADPNVSLADEIDDLDDEETRKRLLREIKRLAFDPNTHDDTKLSATQVWLKLKDMAKAKDLGPGRPLTRAVALERLTSLHRAVLDCRLVVEGAIAAYGPQLVVDSIYALLGIKEPTDEGQTTAEPAEAERGLLGAPEAPGSDPYLPAPDGPAGPL